MAELNWCNIQSLDDINNIALVNEDILKQLDLKPFPENQDKNFYRKYMLSLFEKRLETERNRTIAYEKLGKCNEKSPRYRIYRSEFMYNLVRGNIIDKHIEKARVLIKQT